MFTSQDLSCVGYLSNVFCVLYISKAALGMYGLSLCTVIVHFLFCINGLGESCRVCTLVITMTDNGDDEGEEEEPRREP